MKAAPATILSFDSSPCKPLKTSATWFDGVMSATKIALGYVLNKLHVGGIVDEQIIFDEYSGTEIKVRTGKLFTIITVNERQFYFTRITGKFAGTGSSV